MGVGEARLTSGKVMARVEAICSAKTILGVQLVLLKLMVWEMGQLILASHPHSGVQGKVGEEPTFLESRGGQSQSPKGQEESNFA